MLYNYVNKHEKEWISVLLQMILNDTLQAGGMPPTVFFLDSQNVQTTYSIDHDYEDSYEHTINHFLRQFADMVKARLGISAFMRTNTRLRKGNEPLLHIIIHNPFFIFVYVYDICSGESGKLLYRDHIVDDSIEGDFIHVLKEPFSAN